MRFCPYGQLERSEVVKSGQDQKWPDDHKWPNTTISISNDALLILRIVTSEVEVTSPPSRQFRSQSSLFATFSGLVNERDNRSKVGKIELRLACPCLTIGGLE